MAELFTRRRLFAGMAEAAAGLMVYKLLPPVLAPELPLLAPVEEIINRATRGGLVFIEALQEGSGIITKHGFLTQFVPANTRLNIKWWPEEPVELSLEDVRWMTGLKCRGREYDFKRDHATARVVSVRYGVAGQKSPNLLAEPFQITTSDRLTLQFNHDPWDGPC